MEQELKTLQLFYASALADSVNHYNNAGILSMVTEYKAGQQELTAASQLKQLRVSTPDQLFELFSRVFGCIQWKVENTQQGVVATGNLCLLCSLAKKMQTAQPCFIYCINPFKALLKGMEPSYRLSVWIASFIWLAIFLLIYGYAIFLAATTVFGLFFLLCCNIHFHLQLSLLKSLRSNHSQEKKT